MFFVYITCRIEIKFYLLTYLVCRENRRDNQETLATLGTQDTGRRQSRDTGNIGYTRHRTTTIQRHWQHWAHKT